MGQLNDGTAECDRCGAGLPGYGVLHGMVIVDLDVETGEQVNMIACRENGCRDVVLGELGGTDG